MRRRKGRKRDDFSEALRLMWKGYVDWKRDRKGFSEEENGKISWEISWEIKKPCSS